MEKQHYEAAAKWAERVGLVLFTSLVVQNIFLGANLSNRVLVIGIVLSFSAYFLAFKLLLKS